MRQVSGPVFGVAHKAPSSQILAQYEHGCPSGTVPMGWQPSPPLLHCIPGGHPPALPGWQVAAPQVQMMPEEHHGAREPQSPVQSIFSAHQTLPLAPPVAASCPALPPPVELPPAPPELAPLAPAAPPLPAPPVAPESLTVELEQPSAASPAAIATCASFPIAPTFFPRFGPRSRVVTHRGTFSFPIPYALPARKLPSARTRARRGRARRAPRALPRLRERPAASSDTRLRRAGKGVRARGSPGPSRLGRWRRWS